MKRERDFWLGGDEPFPNDWFAWLANHVAWPHGKRSAVFSIGPELISNPRFLPRRPFFIRNNSRPRISHSAKAYGALIWKRLQYGQLVCLPSVFRLPFATKNVAWGFNFSRGAERTRPQRNFQPAQSPCLRFFDNFADEFSSGINEDAGKLVPLIFSNWFFICFESRRLHL